MEEKIEELKDKMQSIFKSERWKSIGGKLTYKDTLEDKALLTYHCTLYGQQSALDSVEKGLDKVIDYMNLGGQYEWLKKDVAILISREREGLGK